MYRARNGAIYQAKLQLRPSCPWNTAETDQHDAADNEILYALHCDAVHALITEDRGIHDKARARKLLDRAYTIQTSVCLAWSVAPADHTIRIPYPWETRKRQMFFILQR